MCESEPESTESHCNLSKYELQLAKFASELAKSHYEGLHLQGLWGLKATYDSVDWTRGGTELPESEFLKLKYVILLEYGSLSARIW